MAARTHTHLTPFGIAALAAAVAPAAKAEQTMTSAARPRTERSGNGDVDALVARWMR